MKSVKLLLNFKYSYTRFNFVSKSVRRPSVRPSVRSCGCASVTFLVNVSPPKRLDVAISNFVAE